MVIADLNLDEYTHGHSGVLGADGDVDNDASIARFAEVAVAQADAGAAGRAQRDDGWSGQSYPCGTGLRRSSLGGHTGLRREIRLLSLRAVP